MKKSILVISILLFLIVIPMVFAIETEIKIKALAHHDLQIRTFKTTSTTSNLIEYFEESTGEDGLVSIAFSDPEELIRISIIMKKGADIINIGNTPLYNPKQDLATGGIINIDITKNPPTIEIGDGVEEVVEELAEETTEGIDVEVEITDDVEEEELETETNEEGVEEEKQGGKITGAVISGTKSFVTSKITYYIVGGILIAGILFFVVSFTRKKLKNKKGGSYIDFKVKDKEDKLDDKKEELDNKIEEHDDKLEDAERKIDEARKELDEIKNRKGKLKEARERFEKAKKELEKFEN